MSTWRKVAIGLALGLPLLAAAWDGLVFLCGHPEATVCIAARGLNYYTGGLLALAYIALGLHIFFLPWLPAWWWKRKPPDG